MPWETKTEEMKEELAQGKEHLLKKIKEDLIERGYTEKQAEELAVEDLKKLRQNKGLEITADVEPVVPWEERPLSEEAEREEKITEYGRISKERTPEGRIRITSIGIEGRKEREVIPRNKALKKMQKKIPATIPITSEEK